MAFFVAIIAADAQATGEKGSCNRGNKIPFVVYVLRMMVFYLPQYT
jgi:hypothetical protein